MEILSKSTEDTKRSAKLLAEKIHAGDILALRGDLGSGKTTFTRFLVESLGFKSRVQSPTFVIHRKYSSNSSNINVVHHFDLYRLSDKSELIDLNISEYLGAPHSLSIIEWPEILVEFLPSKTIYIDFEFINENERTINVHNLS